MYFKIALHERTKANCYNYFTLYTMPIKPH